jgi:chromosome segregation ATPase
MAEILDLDELERLRARVAELEASRDVWRTRAESAATLIRDLEERADRFEAALRDMTDRYHDASGEADRLHDRIDHAGAYSQERVDALAAALNAEGEAMAYDRGRADERAAWLHEVDAAISTEPGAPRDLEVMMRDIRNWFRAFAEARSR